MPKIMDLFGQSPRPTFNEPMREALANSFGKQIFDWCNGETPLEDCISDCLDVFRFSVTDNGYELAKDFEKKGYSPDPELVEILDCVYSESESILLSYVKRWVIEDKIEPNFEVGENVFVKFCGERFDGTITGINKETAEYWVLIPAKGMTICNTKRAVIKFENAETLENLKPA